jgi:hypothetical protein
MSNGHRHSKPVLHSHAVKFYGEPGSLFQTVAGFLSEGLSARQPAIIIATKDHAGGIVDELQLLKFDVDDARRLGDLVILDADEMLALFMVDNEPNAGLFEHNIGGLIEQTLCNQANTVVRAYGEMVDVLWKQGRSDAAIRLEILWNKLAFKYQFELLCGYAMGSFYKQSQFEAVVAQHTHILQPDPGMMRARARRATGVTADLARTS